MSMIYKGTGWNKYPIGEYDNNIVYQGTGYPKNIIGEYHNNSIFKRRAWSTEQIGEFEGCTLFRGSGWSRDAIGELEDGIIYNRTGVFREPVGEYDGDAMGAAAAALLLDLCTSQGGGYAARKKPKTPEGGDDPNLNEILYCIIGIAVFCFAAYLIVPIAWSSIPASINDGDYTPLITIVIIILSTIIGSIVIFRDKYSHTIIEIGESVFIIDIVSLIIQYVIFYIFCAITKDFTVGLFFSILFGLPIANFGLQIPIFVLQTLLLWTIKRLPIRYQAYSR